MMKFPFVAAGLVASASIACGHAADSSEGETGKITGGPEMASPEKSTGTDGGVGETTLDDVIQEPTGDDEPAASTNPARTSMSCQELSNAARDAYNSSVAGVPYCEIDSDCTRAFPRPGPVCWTECVYSDSNHGSSARESAEIAAMESAEVRGACSEFESMGCAVAPAGCPFIPPSEPAQLKCEAQVCVVVEAAPEDEPDAACPPRDQAESPDCTDEVERIEGKMSSAEVAAWSASPDMVNEVLVLVIREFEICPRPECPGAERECAATDAYAEWLEGAYLASQACVRDRIAEAGGSASPEPLLGNAILANLTWGQIQDVAASPDVTQIESNVSESTPPP